MRTSSRTTVGLALALLALFVPLGTSLVAGATSGDPAPESTESSEPAEPQATEPDPTEPEAEEPTEPTQPEATPSEPTDEPIDPQPIPEIELIKQAGDVQDLDGNGDDSGDTIRYTFTVTNTGNTELTGITVTDTVLGSVDCPASRLDVDESMTCGPVVYEVTADDVTAGQVAGTATVRAAGPSGQDVSDSDSSDTPLTPGRVSVGDFVWVDTDRDGRQDAGEPGIPGVVLTLVGPGGGAVTSVDGAPVGPATTNGDGGYSFDDLPVLASGSYTVRVDNTQAALASYLPTTPGVGDRSGDSSTSQAASQGLTADGDRDRTLDFGFVTDVSDGVVSVGDFVWVDTDRDGVQGVGEPGIAGVTLTLEGPGGESLGSTTTNGSGAYSFDDLPVLPAGQSYTVRIDNDQDALDGYTPTSSGQGTRATDSSTGSATSGDLTDDGDRDDTLDFGFTEPVDPEVPAIRLDKSAGAVEDLDANGVDAGDRIEYGFTVTNIGGVALDPVTVDDPMVGTVTCPSGPLAPQESIDCESVLYTITADDIAFGEVINVAVATGTSPQGEDVSDDDTTTTSLEPIDEPRIRLDKVAGDLVDVDGNGPDAGDTIDFAFEVTNTGAVDLDPVVVDDPMLGEITCPTGVLEPQQSVECDPVTYVVTADDVAAGSVDNTAVATGTPPQGADVTDEDATSTPVVVDPVPAGDPAIELDKKADPDGSRITYTFVVTNVGERPLEDILVSDPKLEAVDCPRTSLDPGEAMTCSGTPYTVTPSDVAAGEVVNEALVTADPESTPSDPYPSPVTDDDTVTVPVDPADEPDDPTEPGDASADADSWIDAGSWMPQTGGPAVLLVWLAGGLVLVGGALLSQRPRK